MTDAVNERDTKSRRSEPPARVERGEQIAISRDVNPTTPAVAARPLTNRELGFVAGGPIAVAFFDALPDDELRRWVSV